MTELIGWIVKKTGEVRKAKKGDYIEYLGKPVVWEAEYPTACCYDILSVTPIPTREEMVKEFYGWVQGKRIFLDSGEDSWLGCYDHLFGTQESSPEDDHYPDDWF